ncbi:Protein of unknown function [Lachnospiraceae bacterium C7]|nr:Protein of unknown function [Lachnospiraceae bacterium C7]
MEQRVLAKWLKIIIIGVGICGIGICFGVLPACGNAILYDYPELTNCFWPWLIFLWVCCVPCYVILGLGWKIANQIGKNQSFSNANAEYLKWISWVMSGDAAFFMVGNILLLLVNMSHPGVMLLSLIVVFVGIAVAVAAAVLSHLVKKAADLQEQSDLTI